MKLFINGTAYLIQNKSIVSSREEAVIIDELTSVPSSTAEDSTDRLVILFDKTRTARWFAETIRQALSSGQEEFHVSKTACWDARYPFGYIYK